MKKDTLRLPPAIHWVRWAFPKLEFLSPALAGRWFTRLFFRPLRYPIPKIEERLLSKSRKAVFQYRGRRIQTYEWGEGPVVLLVHGWMSRAGQFRHFIQDLVKKGYRVVSFDAPGHGHSEGKCSDVAEFSEIIQHLGEKYGGFALILGHSLGGVAGLNAILEKNWSRKLVMISSPAVLSLLLESFRKELNASDQNIPYLLRYARKKFARDFHEYAPEQMLKKLKDTELLIIHDEEDTQVPVHNAHVLRENYPSATLFITQGLGHNRILRNAEVMARVSKMLSEE